MCDLAGRGGGGGIYLFKRKRQQNEGLPHYNTLIGLDTPTLQWLWLHPKLNVLYYTAYIKYQIN